ncbi:amidase family protein [Pseudonocardia lacus]|uniref:amidase family protein n=1 Tax=Pseudonocardia lacus TaxID=2835865 RepID=UPI0027E32DAE|nr:amidase family protein [Pseudonocardia lacus]
MGLGPLPHPLPARGRRGRRPRHAHGAAHRPRHDEFDGDRTAYLHTLPASLSGAPAVSLPAGADADGLPLAVQLVGRPWEDHVVLAAAAAVERDVLPVITGGTSPGTRIG